MRDMPTLNYANYYYWNVSRVLADSRRIEMRALRHLKFHDARTSLNIDSGTCRLRNIRKRIRFREIQCLGN